MDFDLVLNNAAEFTSRVRREALRSGNRALLEIARGVDDIVSACRKQRQADRELIDVLQSESRSQVALIESLRAELVALRKAVEVP